MSTNLLTAAAMAALISLLGGSLVIAHTPPQATQFLPLENEAPPRLIVDPPIPHRLAAGAVLINYRTENFRILPIFGPGSNDVSPRAGHLHVTVDGLPWHWADASGDGTVVVVGLPPGEHSILIELARPDHSVITGQTITFTIPAQSGPSGHH